MSRELRVKEGSDDRREVSSWLEEERVDGEDVCDPCTDRPLFAAEARARIGESKRGQTQHERISKNRIKYRTTINKYERHVRLRRTMGLIGLC